MISDLVLGGDFRVLFNRKEYLKSRSAFDKKMLSLQSIIHTMDSQHQIQGARMTGDMMRLTRHILQAIEDDDSDYEINKMMAEVKKIQGKEQRQLLKVVFKEYAGLSKDVKATKKILKAKDIRKPEKFDLN